MAPASGPAAARRHRRPDPGAGRRPLSPVGVELAAQLDTSRRALAQLGGALTLLEHWGSELRGRLEGGSRLLVAGNGGSAALAHHLVAELVGRYDRERPGFSALALSAEVAGLTAIGNDYGFDRCFARQVEAHGRPGDVLMGLSTSGRSPNLLAAVEAARAGDLVCWAMTGARPNPLADAVDEVLAVPSRFTASIQDAQQAAVHLLCLAFELAAPGDHPDPDGQPGGTGGGRRNGQNGQHGQHGQDRSDEVPR